MSKPIIQNIDQLSANETAAIDLLNRNYDKLREFIELSVFRDGSTPSEMLADLDMNSKRIINLAEPTSDNQAVRLADLKKYTFGSDAKKSAANAKDWAVKMDGKVIDPNTSTEVDYSSKYYADLSRQSADASEASAVLAENQANNAADYASQAEDSAGAAKTSETNAESSETAASGSALAAAKSATVAASAADTAHASAASASESKEAAAAAATAASGSAASAEAFKTAAESAATVANEKAAAVSESALAAAESATAAASAADTAEAWAVGSIEERPEGSAKYWAEKINPDNLADVDLSNLSSAGNAKLPLPWSSFLARNMLASGSIAKDQVRTFTLDYLTNDRLYEVIGSVFFTSNGVVTFRCGSNPVIADAMVSNPTAGTFIATDSSRGAGTFTALVKNKTIRFSNTGSVTATGVYINVAAFREVGD